MITSRSLIPIYIRESKWKQIPKNAFFMLFFLICILNTCFFTNKINFGHLGNFVTVGDIVTHLLHS
jgi:hypothetical protein